MNERIDLDLVESLEILSQDEYENLIKEVNRRRDFRRVLLKIRAKSGVGIMYCKEAWEKYCYLVDDYDFQSRFDMAVQYAREIEKRTRILWSGDEI